MRILVVEDDHTLASTLQHTLACCRYAVDIVANDTAAQQLAHINRYDLILIDLARANSHDANSHGANSYGANSHDANTNGIKTNGTNTNGANPTGLHQRLRQQGVQSPILLTHRPGHPHPQPPALGAGDYFVTPLDTKTLPVWVQGLLSVDRGADSTPHPKCQISPLEQDTPALLEVAKVNSTPQANSLRAAQHQLHQERQRYQREQRRLEMERQQVEARLQQQWNRERLIAQITQSIRQTLDLDQILQAAVDEVRHLLQTDRVIIFGLKTENRGTVAAESVGAGWSALLGTDIRDDCFKANYVDLYRKGRVSAISDTHAAPVKSCYLELLRSFEVRANLVVPILQETALWGLLVVHHCAGPRTWEPDHIQLLVQVAAQLSIAIQQAELYQQARRELQERRHIQAALQDSEERFRSLAAFAPVGIYQTDQDGHYIYTNSCWQQIAGLTFEESLGTGWERSIHPADLNKVSTAWSRFIHEHRPLDLEFRFQTPRGKIRWVHGLATAIYAGADEVVGYVGVNEDITERKRAEQLEAQFHQAQRLESLGRLASGIAHDLNNVLTPILAIAQLLRLPQHPLDEQTKSHLELVERSAKRGASMVKQILTFARGSYEEATPVDLLLLLDDVVEMAQKSFPKSIQIHWQPEEMAARVGVLAASTQLHQVFMNLCINARDAMPDGGVLSVSIEAATVDPTEVQGHSEAKPGQYVRVTVTDTGIGIPPEVRDRMFEPFFTTKAVGQGTGLGLATALGIIKNYGGFLEVESEVGEGTAVKVYLPATTELPNDSLTTAEGPWGQGQTILVIDDDRAVRQSTQSLLEHHGYHAIVADDKTAIATFKAASETPSKPPSEATSKTPSGATSGTQQAVALVIVDVMMPDTDGIALVKQIKAIAPEVKTVVSSGLLEHQQAALAAGADCFLVKPYDLCGLLRQVGQLL